MSDVSIHVELAIDIMHFLRSPEQWEPSDIKAMHDALATLINDSGQWHLSLAEWAETGLPDPSPQRWRP